ncbi:MAG: hypothetical protein VXW65_03015 [Pseudomonadota bacterium]|nr:hypothetical protein [Pseudomonadota bacterium]
MTLEEFFEKVEPAWDWWTSLFEGVPEYPLAVSVYVGGSVLALLLWLRVVRALPRPIGGMSWVILFAILFAPTVTEGANAQLAPAAIGLIFAVITKDHVLMLQSALPILFLIGIGFLLGFLYERLRRTSA